MPTATTSASQPSAAPSVAPEKKAVFTGIVSLKSFGGVCETEKCWLPTQLSTQVVNGQSVTIPEVGSRKSWPNEGDQVHVLRLIKGGQMISDKTGVCKSDLWYKIVVPLQWVDESMRNRVEQVPVYGGVAAFVSAQWVTHLDGTSDIPCKNS
ncbi:MAG TPA: hypothetical protein VK497_03310 [Candidatus Saccharimonadales bacterium]|nr:hypothetical protein [Candidatus Saccharimonadales bacterium]